MGIKDIDINKDGVTLGDHIENMKEKIGGKNAKKS